MIIKDISKRLKYIVYRQLSHHTKLAKKSFFFFKFTLFLVINILKLIKKINKMNTHTYFLKMKRQNSLSR